MEIEGDHSKPHSSRTRTAKASSITTTAAAPHPNPKAKAAASTSNASSPATTSKRNSRTSAPSNLSPSKSNGARTRRGQTQHREAHGDLTSETTSSASSQRGDSPFSAPATPATAFSTSTTVSSSIRSSIGKRAREAEEGQSESTNTAPSTTTTPSRTSANKKAKGKGKAKDTAQAPPSTSAASAPSTHRRTRSSSAVSKQPNPPFTPSKAATTAHAASSSSSKKRSADASKSPDAPAKRQKRGSTGTNPYNLRSRPADAEASPSTSTVAPTTSTSRSKMTPQKGVDDSAKGKGKARGSRSSRGKAFRDADDLDCAQEVQDALGHEDDAPHKQRGTFLDFDADVMMEDADIDRPGSHGDEDEHDLGSNEDLGEGEDGHHDDDAEDDEDHHFEDEEDDEDGEDDDDPYGDARDGMGAGAFGLNLRAMAGYMSGLSGRFRMLLTSLRNSDPTSQLVALQELSELLSVSTEDTLAGYFPTDSFVKELIYIMGGPKPSDGSSNKPKNDEDEEMVAAIAVATAADLEDSGEKELLACRCLANLIEAMPYAAHSVVTHGAIPVLNSKLMEITFIDLAEQVLQTLEKISQDYPGSIVKEGGLSAILQYLDFFNIHVQRTAMTAAANCCRKLSVDSLSMVKDVMPTIQNVLTYSDQRLVESACKCVVRTVESYKHNPDLLEPLLSKELLSAVNGLLLPASSNGGGGSTTSVGTNTYTDVLKALGTACRASPKVAVALLENNIVETLYHLLTGSRAPSDDLTGGSGPASLQTSPKVQAMELESEEAQTGASENAVVAVVSEANGAIAVADMAVLQNLAQRPKEQIQEALSLISELLPPLPRDGVFDSRAYSERAYVKRKAQANKHPKKSNNSTTGDVTSKAASPIKTEGESSGSSSSSSANPSPPKPERQKSEREVAKEAALAKRAEMLKSRTQLVKRFTQLVLPTLVEVYAASVALHVRTKSIHGILKIISFVEPESLQQALDNVPLASFVAAILSSRDHPSLVHGALQIVELLTIKLPEVYTALLRREGVTWEIEDIASKEPSASTKSRKKAEDAVKVKSEPQSQLLSLPGTTSSSSSAGSNSTVVEQSSASAASTGLARLLAATAGGEGLSGSLMTSGVLGQTSRLSATASAASTAEAEADANIWRARVLRDKFQSQTASSEGAQKAVQALDRIKSLVKTLEAEAESDESVARETIDQLTNLFAKRDNPMSSFELLRSGLVEGLYAFATKSSDGVPLERRRAILIESLMTIDESGNTVASILVRRLQESLSRLENVEITTALNGGSEDSRRSPSAMLGKQLRLRLQAEDSMDIPRTCTNVVVTIHAVATFQSLNDYLRPKIAASVAAAANGAPSSSLAGMSSRLSGVLAAFAGATGGPGGFQELESSSSAARSGADAPAKATTAEESGKKEEDQEKQDDAGASRTGSKSQCRRSSRLSGKGLEKKDDEEEAATSASTGKLTAEEGKEMKAAAEEDKHNNNEDSQAEADARATAERLFGGSGGGAAAGEESDEALARRLMEGLLQDEGIDEEGFSDEEFDEEILQSEIAADAPSAAAAGGLVGGDSDTADKTINLDVDKEAGKVVAKTPDGTTIATPANGSGTPKAADGSLPSSTSPSKPSYASALQKKPSDWHLEFSLGDQQLSLDTTIYGAIHRFETSPERASAQSSYIWSNVYTLKYKKVSGPAPAEASSGTPEPTDGTSASVKLPDSVKPDAPYAKLLQLLAVLHNLNAEWHEVFKPGMESQSEFADKARSLNESAFVNNKLTAKLNRQLEEPMIVASACLPAWSTDLPKVFPFLFPFEARFSFLQSTAFGYARLITRWQNLHSRNQDNNSSFRMDDSFGFLGRLQRQKVRISRASLLPSAFKVFELYGSNSSVLEVEYFEEVGTGLGPTLEFYSLVSREFARKDLEMWRDADSGTAASDYVHSSAGLFPAPMDEADLESETTKKRLHAFKILGQFVAKALLDSRIIDCNFSFVFMRAVLNQPMPATLATLSVLDPVLAKSLSSMQRMTPEDVESIGLDFTVPGYPSIELHPGGREQNVDASNVDQYISEVLQISMDSGIRPAVRAFRQGFNLIFPIAAMSSFTADELVMLFGNTDEDWSETTLMSSIKPDHGLNSESASFKDIVAIMSKFTLDERRNFLQWLTGSPKLPIGGFAGLHPQLTIVKRPHEAPLTPDDYLPSVMTCVNYLKMPNYSTRDKMRGRLETAMKEGSTSFHLS